MCFGLGSGLGFYYHRNTDLQTRMPSVMFHGRTGTLEIDLCKHLALEYETGADDDAEHAWSRSKAFIDQNIPVLLHLELSYLPYYNTRTPFPGHRALLAGYDEQRQLALLADAHFPGLQKVTYAALRSARNVPFPPLAVHNQWLVLRPARQTVPVADAIVLALRDNANDILYHGTASQGIAGMRLLAQDFERWRALPDWQFCARLGYQIIERRGTGGGAFRKMYAHYLRQAETVLSVLANANLAQEMNEISDEWTALSVMLKRISEEVTPPSFAEPGDVVARLADREERFWKRVLETLVE
jgi:hypothetical protein